MLIAVDGPAAAGKGTLCNNLAKHFNLAKLDTGMIYRAVAKKVFETGEPINDQVAVEVAQLLSIHDLNKSGLRDEVIGKNASKVAAIPEVREILLEFQRNFAKNPPSNKLGAVLDGRDIGTVVCPDANFKLYITAAPEVRAKRRYKELQERGEEAIRTAILRDIIERDERDRTRLISPLVPADDAHVIDTSELGQDTVFKIALKFITLKNEIAKN